MNIGFGLCGALVIPFSIIGVLFAIFKEKAAKFVSGFNSLSKEEQANCWEVQYESSLSGKFIKDLYRRKQGSRWYQLLLGEGRDIWIPGA